MDKINANQTITAIVAAQAGEAALCDATTHETVCVQARVTITPAVTIGDIQSYCIGDPIIGGCPGTASRTCTFDVGQNLCVEVPLTFSASATAEPTGIICGRPLPGPCTTSTGCTLTIGYFATHPDVTEALINSAPGGEIILGIDSEGCSITVTAANANDILTLNPPTPPAPADPPFADQYQILYAQLLAAQLNILNGATCDFVVVAIENANAFIAASPYGVGQDGAPDYQDPLADFNEGLVPSCPGHCPGD